MSDTLLKGQSLTKRFGGLTALEGVDIQIHEGEIVGLIGPNGAGKTTLFNCLSGVFAPTEGSVHIRSEETTDWPAHKLAKFGLARTFQITRPIDQLTVLNNVMLGAHVQTRRRSSAEIIAMEALDFVGIADLTERKAGQLNIGHQKMMELARVFATDPDMLLIDEIMAGLNPSESQKIIDQLKRMQDQNITMLVIEHDMETIMNLSDRVVVLNNGKKLVEGDPETVASDDRVVEVYLGDNDA